MGEIIRRTGPEFVFNVIIAQAVQGVTVVAGGNDGKGYFDIATALAIVYEREFNKDGPYQLVRRYRAYNADACRKKQEGDALLDAGAALFDQKDLGGAVLKWAAALDHFKGLEDWRGESLALSNLGTALMTQGRHAEAIESLRQGSERARRLDDKRLEAELWDSIGSAYEKMGQWEKTAESYLQALAAVRELGDPEEAAYFLGTLGGLYQKHYQFRVAIDYSQKALEIFERLHRTGDAISARINIAKSLAGFGLRKDAAEAFAEVLEMIRRSKDTANEAQVLELLGMTEQDQGEYEKALRSYAQALEINKAAGNRRGEASLLMAIGTAHKDCGRYAAALDAYQKALGLARELESPDLEGPVLGNIGVLYKLLGQPDEALPYLSQALEKLLPREPENSARIYLALGNVYDDLGDDPKALENYGRSFELSNRINDLVGVSMALGNKARILARSNQIESALKHFMLVRDANRATYDKDAEATTLLNIGSLHAKLSEEMQAQGAFDEARKIAEEIGDREALWRAYVGLGQTAWRGGSPEEALGRYRMAITCVEELFRGSKGLGEAERLSLTGTKIDVFKEMIELLSELHRRSPARGYDREAFVVSEKARSRLFLELMEKAGARTVLSREPGFETLIERERRLLGDRDENQFLLARELSRPRNAIDARRVETLRSALAQGEQDLARLEAEMETRFPRYADLKRPAPLTVDELQKNLGPDETVVDYSIGRNQSAAFIVGQGRFRMIDLGLTGDDLGRMVDRFRTGLANITGWDDLERFDPEAAFLLYQKVFFPLAEELKGTRRLTIVPDGALYTVPFEALVDRAVDLAAFRGDRSRGRTAAGPYLGEYAGLHYLVDTYTLTYLPSASVLRSLRKYGEPGSGRWTRPLIAFADPVFSEAQGAGEGSSAITGRGMSPETKIMLKLLGRSSGDATFPRLAESAQEAQAVAREVGGRAEDIFLREDATEENARRAELKSARYVLFSTHGLLGGDFSGVAEPALVLTLVGNPEGQDGFLTMSEVLGLDLAADLVVLSACNTSGRAGQGGGGEGFAGLTRSFMYSGSRALAVTHWSVESEAARDLIIGLFKYARTLPKPEAMRMAKLGLRAASRTVENTRTSLAHPFFWAPFVLVGENR